MIKKELTTTQVACIASLIIFGRLSLIGESAVGRDVWMVFIFAFLLGIPLMFIFSSLRTGESVRDIFYNCLGLKLGNLSIILLSLVAIIIASSGTTVFTVFISATPVENSLSVPSILLMTLTIIILLLVSEGTLGRSCGLILPFVSILSIISFISAIGHFDYGSIFPILEDGSTKLIRGISTSVGMQIAPLIFLVLSSALSMKPIKLNKGLITGLFIACMLLCLAHLRNLLILGYPTVSTYRFPNYIALSQVKMGGLFQGMEIIITQAFLLCLPIKSAICLRFVQKVVAENRPKIRILLSIILPIISGVLAFLASGKPYDKIISSSIFKISLSMIMLLIPCVMATSLFIQRILKRNKKKAAQ